MIESYYLCNKQLTILNEFSAIIKSSDDGNASRTLSIQDFISDCSTGTFGICTCDG